MTPEELIESVEKAAEYQDQHGKAELHIDGADLEVDFHSIRAALVEAKRVREARFPVWTCGCGWVNGTNLSTCAMCDRSPKDGNAVYGDMQAAIRSVADAISAKLADRDREVAEAVAAEREACAKIAEAWQFGVNARAAGKRIADSIRASAALTPPRPGPGISVRE